MSDPEQQAVAEVPDRTTWLNTAERGTLLGIQIVFFMATVFGRAPARLLVREILDAGPFLTEAGRETVRSLLDTVSAFLSAGMDAGAFHRQDPRHLVDHP